MKPSAKDLFFMERALELARRGAGRVHPNPMVGAVVVKGGRIIAEGAHLEFGGPHAEAHALRRAGAAARGATLYVTLEPCPHTGKTPPCTDLLIEKKIREVVVAASDPNPIVSGKGLRRLKRAGVRVRAGVMAAEASRMNRAYERRIKTGMPYAVVKVAQSVDGKIATRSGRSRWISGEPSRDFVHRLRAASDAVLVGVNTVLRDDPRLSARGAAAAGSPAVGRQPLKVVVDSALRTPPGSRLFSDGRTLIAVTPKADRSRFSRFKGKAEILVLPGKKGRVDLSLLFRELARRGVTQILVEGGGEVIADAFAGRLVQEAYFITAPILIGGDRAPGSVRGAGVDDLRKAVRFRDWQAARLGDDLVWHGTI
ncbi:MAG TPA: bifunctional diaminohydroxyphosphoribosylaminopyrimidine deaminase/5-amino-6-(5-phosphoribosylamino)uracil reductase RibD [Candidatus Eisenbacteria bacterium]|nr:bifunctional diaminohydroxyphosphoribosylaminopyrimidine deaminase/5-amino-6-(5-phosphoribosylamino)uracil reductase RibD [Candidatus Eisenbacteria bacterium]